MNTIQLINQIERLRTDIKNRNTTVPTIYYETTQILSDFLKPNNSFSENIIPLNNSNHKEVRANLGGILEAFQRYLENGLYGALTPEKEVKLIVYNDYLNQAKTMLNNVNIHPAASTVIAGASLEEFLRDWCQTEGLHINGNGNMEKYKAALITQGLISTQDGKDITSWGGLRNSAAHGLWGEVDNRSTINLMIEGISIFIKKYTT